ncbi:MULTISPECIES: thiamine phosphate synthase [unclassified Nocardioides]|uniref:thiamine phosphate synthase n=1 Tax=unclassified Nocardioides TaxID=2615069 RepID=UPI003611B88D
MRRLPRLLVVVPAGGVARVESGPEVLVVPELDLVKCHSVDEVAAARAEFVTLSPVAPSLSKPGYGPPLGVEGVRAAAAVAGGTPFFALGGVDAGNARSFLDAGAHGVAVMGAVLRADDPDRVVVELLEAIA